MSAYFPAELHHRKQWVVWRPEQRGRKPTKVPYRADGKGRADSTDPETWSLYEDAVAALELGHYDGLGFVFTDDGPYCGIDLDGCVDEDGKIHPAAKKIAELSFSEPSPSGDGVHVILNASKNGHRRCRTDDVPWGGKIEIYDRDRFFTMTGKGSGRILNRQAELEALLERYLPEKSPSSSPTGDAPAGHGDEPAVPDSDVLERVFDAANGAASRALYEHADASVLEAGKDTTPSGLVASMIGRLIFYTQDPDQLERLMRGSTALANEKWDTRRGAATWLRQDIEKALANRTAGPEAEFYDWGDRRSTAGATGGNSEGQGSGTPVPDLLAQRVRIEEIIAAGIPPPTYLPSPSLGDELFYDQSLLVISGHRKSGKTTAVARQSIDVMENGRDVVYLDFENGEDLFAERMKDLGAPIQLLSKHFHYIPFPKNVTAANAREKLKAIEVNLPNAVVIIDSLRGWANRLWTAKTPFNVNDQSHIEAVLGPVNEAVKTSSLTAIVIDHAKKDGSDEDEYATAGAAAKEAVVDAIYFWTKADKFSEALKGSVTLLVMGDRRGRLFTDRKCWQIGGQGAGNPIRYEPVAWLRVGKAGEIWDRLIEFGQDNPGEKFTKTALEKGIEGKDSTIRAVIAAQAADGDVAWCQIDGSRAGSFKYVYEPERGGTGAPKI